MSAEHNTHISKKVFRELAQKNVKESAKDYLIYFFTLALAVSLFYTFNSISTQFATLGIPDSLNYLSFSSSILVFVSIFICGVIGFLIVYANRFLLRRRKKEIGIYCTLGMEQKEISSLMMHETLIIGTGSLIIGLFLGIFFSQLLSLITAKLIDVSLKNYRFMVSGKAILFSLIFFGLVFLFVHLFQQRELKKLRLIELLRADRQNEAVWDGKLSGLFQFLASLALMAGGSVFLLTQAAGSILNTALIGCSLFGAGTFLFFFSVGSLLPGMMRKKRSFYYKKLNMFVINQLYSRLKSTGFSISVTCILLFFALSSASIGLGMGSFLVKDIALAAPFGASITFDSADAALDNADRPAEEALKRLGLEVTDYTEEVAELTLYTAEDVTGQQFLLPGSPDKFSGMFSADPISALGVEDYNRMRSLQGLAPIVLGETEYALNYNAAEAKDILEFYAAHQTKPLVIQGQALALAEHCLFRSTYQNRNLLTDSGTLILPQRIADSLQAKRLVCNLNFRDDKAYEAFWDHYLKLPPSFSLNTQQNILVELTSSNLLFTYVGVYLGITFLITAGAVLALQQLSQSVDNRSRYVLLRRLGAPIKDRRDSMLAQLGIYFGLPFALALIQSAILVIGTYRQFHNLSPGTMLWNVLVSFGIIIGIYVLYFAAAWIGSKRILDI